MAIDKIQDNVVSVLSSSISDTSEALTVENDFTGMTVPNEAYLVIGGPKELQPGGDGSHPTGEVVKYTTYVDNGDGTVTFGEVGGATLTRGVGNTDAQSWGSGVPVGLALTAEYYNIFLDAIEPRDANNFIFKNIYALVGGLSSPPTSPSAGWMYPDDGTNTETGNPSLRIYYNTSWHDLGQGYVDTHAAASQNVHGVGANDVASMADLYTDSDALSAVQAGLTMSGNIVPDIDSSRKLGTATEKFSEVHANSIYGTTYYDDIIFKEKKCAICGKKFTEGDIVSLIVTDVVDEGTREDGTHMVPVHSTCQGDS